MTQKMLRPLLIAKGIYNYVYWVYIRVWKVCINMVYLVLVNLEAPSL